MRFLTFVGGMAKKVNEIKAEDILLCAKKFPMMGDKQLIIVKNGKYLLNL